MRRLLLISILTLAACSHPVPSFIVAPQLFANPSNQLNQVAFNLVVQDNRPSQGTLIMRSGDKVETYPTSNNLSQHLEQVLTTAMSQQGARVSGAEPIVVTLQINQLEANAELKTVEHVVDNFVEMTVLIDRNSDSFNKSYSGKSRFSGPLKLDNAVAERELRILTEQVLGNILRDSSWQEFLRN